MQHTCWSHWKPMRPLFVAFYVLACVTLHSLGESSPSSVWRHKERTQDQTEASDFKSFHRTTEGKVGFVVGVGVAVEIGVGGVGLVSDHGYA